MINLIVGMLVGASIVVVRIVYKFTKLRDNLTYKEEEELDRLLDKMKGKGD